MTIHDSSQVVDHVRSKWSSDGSTEILYFYFDLRAAHSATDTSFLLSMIAQLRQQAQPALVFSSEPEPMQYTVESMSFEILVRLFVSLLKQKQLKRTFIVVDALDECRNSRRLLASLRSIVTDFDNVQIFLSSRLDNEIVFQLRTLETTLQTVDMAPSNCWADVVHFAKATLDAETNWTPEIKDKAVQAISSRSNGS